MAASLKAKGVNVVAYHAGMSADMRQEAQEAFTRERCDVVVATVAFGMGIDRSNVRFVLHVAMPKSLEHYQQETGRAGRDGLEAECVLLHSGADYVTLKSILEKSANEAGADPSFLVNALKHLDDMDRYARGAVCRHRALVEHFGQTYAAETCNACDLCLGDVEEVPGALVTAQKILSCVARVKESFGIGHVVSVLRGEESDNVRRRGHDQLTTFGLLKGESKVDVRDWVYQLLGQKVLMQVGAEYPLLHLNEASWEVMRGQRPVRLVRLVRRRKGQGPEKSAAAEVSWEGVDAPLFEALRELRRQIAQERGEKPYMIFGDAVLRELARVRPSTPERMRHISGIGDVKLRDFANRFLPVIADRCRERNLPMDVTARPGAAPQRARPADKLPVRGQAAFELFRKNTTIADVMKRLNYARSTVVEYLAEYIRVERPASIAPWVPQGVVLDVREAARRVGGDRLKPIFLALGENVPYDDIRLVLAHLQSPT